MTKWLTSYEAGDLIGKHRVSVEVMGRSGRVRRKMGVSPERHKRPMWLYHVDDVLDPKPPGTFAGGVKKAPRVNTDDTDYQVDRMARLIMARPWNKSLRLNG